MDDLIFQKISIIKNCLSRVFDITGLDPQSLDNLDKQDAFVLNLQRAIRAAIDLTNVLIRTNNWKTPSTYADGFDIVNKEGVITDAVSTQMKKMCGFRNIAVHEYREISLEILKSILKHHLTDIELFYQQVILYEEVDK